VIFADYAADLARRVAAAEPANVLEIAAGTGIVTRALRDAAARSELVATDLSPAMLEIARPKFRADETVTFQPADALALPFADASFDVVACQFGIMFYPDKDQGNREAFRVLKPGGRYIFSVWDAHRNVPFARIAHELATRLFPNDPPQFMKVPFSYGFDAAQDSLVGGRASRMLRRRGDGRQGDPRHAAVRDRRGRRLAVQRPARGARHGDRAGDRPAHDGIRARLWQAGADAAPRHRVRGAEALGARPTPMENQR
jgi:SAM-dependent methyltransferase